jgi:hypothetical protein
LTTFALVQIDCVNLERTSVCKIGLVLHEYLQYRGMNERLSVAASSIWRHAEGTVFCARSKWAGSRALRLEAIKIAVPPTHLTVNFNPLRRTPSPEHAYCLLRHGLWRVPLDAGNRQCVSKTALHDTK